MGITWIKQSEPQPAPAFTFQNMIKHRNQVHIDKNYEILEVLGKGSYAEVHKCREKHTGGLRAVKIIDRIKHAKVEPLLLNEFEILRHMDHPNILKIYEIYEEHNYYYIVMEMCPGKELFDLLKDKKRFTEEEARKVFYQIVSAVAYMHAKSTMHRDLKPENVMYDPLTNSLKLIDFGTALVFDDRQLQQRRRVGTSYYLAPEVIQRRYNHKCDIWSLGVVLYILLSGQPPFKGKKDDEVMANVLKGQYGFKSEVWQQISSQAKLLIAETLQADVEKRPQAFQLLNSDWLKKSYKNELSFPETREGNLKKALLNMQKIKGTKSNNIQGAVLVFIVNFIKKPQDQIELQKCFKELDLNGDGILSREELSLGLEKFLQVGVKEANVMAESIFDRIDTNNSGFIDYSQFLVAASSIEMTATPENIGLAFDYMDEDRNGWLSLEEIQARLGDNIPKETYKHMLREFKKNHNGEINKQCFVATLTKIMFEK